MKFIQLSLFGPDREEDVSFYPEKHLVGEEHLKKKGSSKRKIEEAQEVAEQLVLPLEDERLMRDLPS